MSTFYVAFFNKVSFKTGSSIVSFSTFLDPVSSKTARSFFKSFSKLSLFSDCIFLEISRSVFYNTF